ncbi:GCN5 family acetyltransferase [Methylobacterium radiotolerans]|nr:GCN5 family acetyltransferase [Methylobacterium radiotolerans]
MRVRTATGADAAAIAGLMDQLGYAAGADLIADKLGVLARSADDAVLLAVKGERVIGCLSAHAHELFHAPGRLGRITTLIIDADTRGQGVGRALIEAATRYFENRGCVRVEVTSGDHRPSAHAFYQSVGFVVDERRFVRKLEPR